MKKNYFLYGIAISFLAMIFANSCNNSAEKTAEEKTKDSISAMVKRGDYLVNTICNCMHCHGDRDFTKFSGPLVPGTAGKGGEEIAKGVFVRNITPYTLGSWTDDELYKVLTTGITKDGDTLFPFMPYSNYVKMPKKEVYSIIAYLRMLPSIKNDAKPRHMNDEAKAFATAIYNNYYSKQAQIKLPLPTEGDKVKLGEYLVNAGDCMGCHAEFDGEKMEYDNEVYLAGGGIMGKRLGFKVTVANLTPNTATGLGGWTEDMFLAKFKNYRDSSNYSYNPGRFNTVMPWTILAKMKDDDIRAIYAYLRTLKPVNNKFEKWPQ